jgi:predicted nucleic acid-binding protein
MSDGHARRRVVIDTNVFVGAAFNGESASAVVVDSVREGQASMPWTDGTFGEIRRVLEKIPPVDWTDFEDLFRPETHRETPHDQSGLEWVPDLEDRKFAALAREVGAVLVSNDRHLLARRGEASFAVLTPREFTARLTSEKGSGQA